MKIERVWAMPSKNTFDVLPIGKFVKYYLSKSKVSIDPFARDKKWATYTNDLNPKTKAEYHLDVLDFLQLMTIKNIRADLILFDLPYSPRQIKECYDGIGLEMGGREALRSATWKKERDLIDKLITPEGIVLSFNWNSMGMGRKRHYEILELLLVCHGSAHNDTICVAERKLPDLFDKE